MKNFQIKKIIIAAMILLVFGVTLRTIAAAPSGNFWFQFFTQTQTGSDNTGDGGTGSPTDYNYYYVGQSVTFRTDVSIGAGYPSNTADFIVNYDKNILSGSSLSPLSAYQNWIGVGIDNAIGKFNISAYNNPGVYYTGQRQYSNITFTMLRPTAFNYGSTSTALNIFYTPGSSTDTNIARDGIDYMDSEEDFNMIVLADTKNPYAKNPVPVDGATNIAVNSNYTFDVRDSKNGEGDDSGVGTGFAAPPTGRAININNGVSTTSYTGFTNHGCSGTWQSLCNATISPTSPLGIGGDTRKWNYNTLYTVNISGYTDRGSNNQNQLGDANGPNVMNTKSWTFRTESDTIPPQVSARTPVPGSTYVSLSTNIVVDIIDIKATSISGTGIDLSTCYINVSSPSLPLTTYTNISSGVVATSIPYGYRFTITPAEPLPQYEIVSVSTYGCKDLAGNTMSADNFTFTTVDTTAPYIASFSPSSNQLVSVSTPVNFLIINAGAGVDINNTIVSIGGNFYKKGGGAGSVISASSTIPISISFSTSIDLTPYITATSTNAGSGYIVLIDDLSLSTSQSVPVSIYSKNLSGNLMPSYFTSFATIDGSTYCGTNTTWDGYRCVGTSGATPPATSGQISGACILPNNNPQLGVSNAFATQINANGVLVTWNSGDLATGQVRYGSSPNNLNNTVDEISNSGPSTYHSITISNLETGKLYYFEPISKKGSQTISGPILKMSPAYSITNITGQSPNNISNSNSIYTTTCRPIEIIKEINPTDGSVIQSYNINNKPVSLDASSTIIQKTAKVISKNSIYFVAGAALALTAGALSVMFIRVRRKISLKNKNQISMPKVKLTLIGKILAAIVALSLLFLILKNSNNIINFVSDLSVSKPKNVSVSGNVLDPFTLQGVGNVDLNTANVSVKTAPDGNYAFEAINNHEGIKITHPNLQRALLVDLSQIKSGNRLSIYFDADMYNTLNTYLNDLSQNKWFKAADSLTNSCKERVSADALSKEDLSFNQDFSSLQTLNISKLDSVTGWYSDTCQNKFERVALVNVKIGDKYEKFVLTKEGDTWKVVK